MTDFLFRSGDLSSGSADLSNTAMLKGAKVHRKLQKERKDKCPYYKTEYKVKLQTECRGFTYNISGQIDGLTPNGDGSVIDEFKTTTKKAQLLDWDTYPAYSAQVKMYGCMYCLENSLSFVTLCLSFYDYDGDEVSTLQREYTFTELYSWFEQTLSKYTQWMELSYNHKMLRDASIGKLSFPFGEYRKNQRELCAKVYRCIRDSKRLYAQAPTGIGKTVSTLFPALKAVGESHGEKVFYLSAKTVGALAASDCMGIMNKSGLVSKTILLNAKERICPHKETGCMVGECEECEGHFDRVNEALFELVSDSGIIDIARIQQLAQKHKVCPFELQLDASEFCDVVIGDYNYFFDPKAHLMRYFNDGGNYIVLCDEAHNLAERAREMFSSRLSVLFVKSFSKHFKTKRALLNKLKKCVDVLENYRIKLSATDKTDLKECLSATELEPFFAFCDAYLRFLSDEGNKDIKKATLELYFELSFFTQIYMLNSSNPDFFEEYIHKENTDCIYNIVCTDPSQLINEACGKIRSTVFFSATLSPFDYYLRMLGKGEDDELIDVPSPFPKDNLVVCVVKNISTRFRDREASMEYACEIVYAACSVKTGNYMVFFPSYSYMNACFDLFCDMYPNIDAVCQTQNMTKEQKEEFLDRFCANPTQSLVAFCLCGGIFSEGVDLVGDRLSGAVVIGTGMPGISFERDLLKEHFDKTIGENCGFNFAYTYAGLNNVFQAGGRVIRTQNDVGFIVLADDRYMKISHRKNMPEHWKNFNIVSDSQTLGDIVKSFLDKGDL